MSPSQPRHRHCAPFQGCPRAPALVFSIGVSSGSSPQKFGVGRLEGLWVAAKVMFLSSELRLSFPLEAAAVLIPGRACPGAHAGVHLPAGGTPAAPACPLGCGVLNSGCASGNLGWWGSLTAGSRAGAPCDAFSSSSAANCPHKRIEKWKVNLSSPFA